MTEILDIVNEYDEVIGQIERDDTRKDDHIIRHVFIGFYTPDKQLIMQKRSMKKINNPGKYTVTVSGHVESGWNYKDTAVKEAREESGVAIDPEKLVRICVRLESNVMRAVFAYPYGDNIDNLRIEEDEGDGFKLISIDELRRELNENPHQYTPFLHTESCSQLLDYIETRL